MRIVESNTWTIKFIPLDLFVFRYSKDAEWSRVDTKYLPQQLSCQHGAENHVNIETASQYIVIE